MMAINAGEIARGPVAVSRSRARSRLALAAILAIVVLDATPGVTAPKKRLHELDGWLAAHPNVAAALIWEFPPTREVSVPYVPKRIIHWPFRGIGPDPVFIAALTGIVFRDPLLGQPRDTEPERSSDGSPAREQASVVGFQSDVFIDPTPAPALPSSILSNGPPLLLPGGVKKSEYGAEIRSWKQWPEWAREELRTRYTVYRTWLDTA